MNLNRVMDELAAVLRSQHLALDGTAGTFASTPDSAVLSITGDIDLRVEATADDWTPVAQQQLVDKQGSYALAVAPTGRLRMTHNNPLFDATDSTVATGFTDGTKHEVRATRVTATGVVTFFIDGTQLGDPVTDTVGDLADTANPVAIGATPAGANPFAGKVDSAEVRDGIDGTVVANPRFSDGSEWDEAATSATDDAGNVWTLNGAATIEQVGIGGLRTYAYPTDSIAVPAAVIAFPESLEYDQTYGRGSDRMTLPLHVLVGRVSDRTAQDDLGAFADGSGAESVKQVLENGSYTALDSLRVMDAQFGTFTVNGIDYLGATFRVDVFGQGS